MTDEERSVRDRIAIVSRIRPKTPETRVELRTLRTWIEQINVRSNGCSSIVRARRV